MIRLTYFCSVNLDVNVKVERGSTLTFTRDLTYIVSLFIYACKISRAYARKNYATVEINLNTY